MKKYKKTLHIYDFQQKLDNKYGKGKFHAVLVLSLFFCLLFTSCSNDLHNSGTTNQSNIGGSIEGTTHEGQSSGARIQITNTGQTVTLNKPPYGDNPTVLDAYFARQDTKSNEYKKINSAIIGDVVYIVVDTANLFAKKITVTIKDKNNIISGNIPFQQYKSNGNKFADKYEDVEGIFESKVRNEINDQRFALYKIALKGKDEVTTKKWKEDIEKHSEKKLQLSLTVQADEKNVIYCGSNNVKDNERNVWLNQDGKWFGVSLSSCFCSKLKIDSEGFISGGKVEKNKIASCNNGSNMTEVKIIVLHRTAGGVAAGTLSHMNTNKYGAHFVIDNAKNTDGTIYHAISIYKKGTHMGTGQYKITKDNNWGNHNSIGIEVCGYSYTSDGKKRVGANGNLPHGYWQEVTEE